MVQQLQIPLWMYYTPPNFVIQSRCSRLHRYLQQHPVIEKLSNPILNVFTIKALSKTLDNQNEIKATVIQIILRIQNSSLKVVAAT